MLGRVLQVNPDDQIIAYPGNQTLIKVQRRQYVRIPTTVDAAIHPLENEFTPFTTITEDISAGGTLLSMNPQAKGFNQR